MSRRQRVWGPPACRQAPRRLSRGFGVCLAMLSMAVTAACTGQTAVSRSGATPASGAAPLSDSAAVLERAMRSLSSSGSVRMAMDIKEQGHHFRNITYAAADRGRHEITLDGMHASVRVVGDRTFARGDRSSLTGYFGLSDSTAQRLENRWYLLLDGDPGFDDATSGVTLASLATKVRSLLPIEPLQLLKSTVRNGVRVTGVRGSSPDASDSSDTSVTLWVSADSRGLPVEIELDDYAAHLQLVADFDHWGDPVRVSAPTGAVRLATLPPLTVDS